MPRVTTEHMTNRRNQILFAAERCFSRNGFHKTTMQDIISESELSAGAIYNYFKSKEEIIESIAQQRHVSEKEDLDTFADNILSSDPLRDLAHHFVGQLLTEDGVRQRKVSVLAWAEALLNPTVAKSVLEGLRGPQQALVDMLSQYNLPGDTTPEATARIIIATFHGFVLQMLWDPDTPHRDMLDVFEKMLGAVAETPLRQSGDT